MGMFTPMFTPCSNLCLHYPHTSVSTMFTPMFTPCSHICVHHVHSYVNTTTAVSLYSTAVFFLLVRKKKQFYISDRISHLSNYVGASENTNIYLSRNKVLV